MVSISRRKVDGRLVGIAFRDCTKLLFVASGFYHADRVAGLAAGTREDVGRDGRADEDDRTRYGRSPGEERGEIFLLQNYKHDEKIMITRYTFDGVVA